MVGDGDDDDDNDNGNDDGDYDDDDDDGGVKSNLSNNDELAVLIAKKKVIT